MFPPPKKIQKKIVFEKKKLYISRKRFFFRIFLFGQIQKKKRWKTPEKTKQKKKKEKNTNEKN